MKMTFDMEGGLAARSAASAGNHASGQFDWHGLRSRMAAAYAARSVLGLAKPQETVVAGGSFDPGCARTLTVYGIGQFGGLDPVNPTALANGNAGCDNDAAVAGTYSVGD
jgi:hypothetical protein